MHRKLFCYTHSALPGAVNEEHNLWLPLQTCDMSYSHVRAMLEFAIALMSKLELINTHSFNSFKLRIGESVVGGN